MSKNKWNKSIPVEKSSYLNDDETVFYNLEQAEFDINKLNMLDLFCGAGGFSVGCSWAGFQTLIGIDHFQPAMETWVKNHPNAIGCLGDIKKIEPKYIKDLLIKKGIKSVDLITGGVPCQGFSIANRKHNDDDERNYLFKEFMRFVEEFNPRCIILENVSGMRSTAGGKFEKEIINYMDKLGYNATVKLVNAAEYGVPQLRHRLIFVGYRKDLNLLYEFPKGNYIGKYRTVGDAISDLPPLNNNENKTKYINKSLNDFQKLMRGFGNIKEIKQTKFLYNHEAPNHPLETIDKIANTKPGMPMYQKFKQRIRLANDLPSPTQLAGGIRPQFQFGHPTQNRGLSIRERARIQTFPDDFIFCGGIVQERVQTGNAVPPLLIYNIVSSIVNDLNNSIGGADV